MKTNVSKIRVVEPLSSELHGHLAHLDSIDDEIEALQSQLRSLQQARLAHQEIVDQMTRALSKEMRMRLGLRR